MKILTRNAFLTIAKYVLREGDRQTYCNKFNHNPHIEHANFDVFLNPAGQQNINCDESVGGFDEIIFRDEHKGSTVYTNVRLVDEKLTFEPDARDPLEYYFAALIAHISQQA